ncbi:nicotinate phosphoribosyltransferase [Absidia repens]|uniref:Nicotinate phosphoribosyltransferase n=1 Tax=Absidia repens TaxID=90262 RepID=A0A1X2IWD9_9FUNG|nr:nicotinate phosphoribosyltransferase [Absidia repens]
MTDLALVSLLDNDLYKFTMQHAVLQHYKDAQVTYQFTNREKNLHLNAEAVDWLTKQVQGMANLTLTEEEQAYLSQLSFFDSAYVDYLVDFRYQPSEHVKIKFDSATGDLDLEISGLWHETILYEVPLLALISESYFRYVDRDWNYDDQPERAQLKAKRLLDAGCVFSEFGTRRRRDFKTHDIVMSALTLEYKTYQDQCKEGGVTPVGALSGTSNVHLARKYNVTPIGTVAHEFFMALSSLEGVEGANRKTLEKWYDTYHGALGIALTDTFTTPVFLKDFGHDLANKYIGVRQDSGSPSDFIPLMVDHYKSLGIDPQTKVIVFSDSLDVDRAINLLALSKKHGIKASFGIGTSFTNDYQKLSNPSEKSKPLNIVIKIKECNGKRVIKLSDDVLKHSADMTTVAEFKRQLGL